MRQRLGQHFLKNKSKIKKIVEALELKKGDVVVEIGPGHGELTIEIRNKKLENRIIAIRIIAIEKDKMLVNNLKEKFKDDSDIEIIEGDALKILPQLTTNYQLSRRFGRDPDFTSGLTTNYKLCGNIPYYITGRLLRILSELKNKPKIIALTIQKEVARRIMALKPSSLNSYGRVRIAEGKRPEARDSHAMNLLAAIVQFWAEPKIIGYISKKDFKPAPKVDSAIIRLRTIDKKLQTKNTEKYYKFMKILFRQPRKTVVNNLCDTNLRMHTNDTNNTKIITKEEIITKLQSLKINPNDRPQNLTLEQIKRLSTLF